MREGGDRAEGEVGAAVELELLQRRAPAGDGHEPVGLRGGGGGRETAEVGEARGDGGEPPVERVVVDETAGAERRVGAGV